MRIWPTKRRLKRIGIGFAIVFALLLIANGFLAWQTDRQIQRRFAAIRAAGDPATISDLAPAPIPDDENAAIILRRIGPRLDAFSKAYSSFLDSPLGKDYDERSEHGERPSSEQLDTIRSILATYPDVSAALTQAASRPKYASLADYSLNHQQFLDAWLKNEVLRIRTAARFLNWQSEILSVAGEHDAAVHKGVELLHIARHYDNEPLLINYLVAIALRGIATRMMYDALATGPVPPDTHLEVDKELALHDSPQRLLHALKTERGFGGSVIMEAGTVGVVVATRPFYFKILTWPMRRVYANSCNYMDEQIAMVGKSWPGSNANIGRLAPSKTNLGVMAELLQPALQAAYDAESRNIATMRALRIFNALTEYRDTNSKEAAGLSDLKLPPATTIDPYSGQQLLLRKTDEGWIVYSVAQNGVDDGGDFKELKDYGVAPAKWRATQ